MVALIAPGVLLTPEEWEKANDGAIRRHDEALRNFHAYALSLIRSISDDACSCPDGLFGICPPCRCRSFLGTPAQPARRSTR